MKHEKIKELLPLYIDNGLTEHEEKLVKDHLQNCKKCQKELKHYQKNYIFLSSQKEIKVPTGFKKSILNKLSEKKKDSHVNKEKGELSLLKRIKKIFAFPVKIPAGVIGIAALVLLVFITNLPATMLNNNDSINNNLVQREGINNQAQYFSSLDSAQDNRMKIAESTPQRNVNLLSNTPNTQLEQKIIKRANLVIEINNLDNVDKNINELIEKYNGYISDSRNWLNQNKQKFYWFELKVPANNFQQVLDQLSRKEYAETISRSISSQDVTEEYMDIGIRLENLLSQEERYRQLLDKATKVEEILSIENELNRVRTEIERLQGRKKYLDNQISFSTITLEIRQPEPISSRTPGIIRALRNAVIKMVDQFYSIIILIGTAIPYLLLLLIGFLIYRNRKRK